jgi:hypothetical protein
MRGQRVQQRQPRPLPPDNHPSRPRPDARGLRNLEVEEDGRKPSVHLAKPGSSNGAVSNRCLSRGDRGFELRRVAVAGGRSVGLMNASGNRRFEISRVFRPVRKHQGFRYSRRACNCVLSPVLSPKGRKAGPYARLFVHPWEEKDLTFYATRSRRLQSKTGIPPLVARSWINLRLL